MPVSEFAFLELKKRLINLEKQHNDLTTLCLILARKLKEVKGVSFETPKRNFNNNKKSIKQLFNDKLNERKSTIKEVKIKNKRRTKKVVVESESDPEESESSSEESEEIEEVKIQPKKKTTRKKTPSKKITRRKNTKKNDKSKDTKKNMTIEIVDSMTM